MANKGKPDDEPHLLKVIRGEVPSVLFGDRFMTDEAKRAAREAHEQASGAGWERLARRFRERRELKELRSEVERLKKSPKTKPAGFDGLKNKKLDLSMYFALAGLTDIQRSCASLIAEYRLTVSETARRLGKHRSTVQYHYRRALQKLEHARSSKGRTRPEVE